MLSLFRYLRGYLKLEISGEFAEKMLNLTAQNQIKMWGLFCKKGIITGFIAVSDFKKMRKVLRGSGIKVHIVEKSGLPFKMQKYNGRIGFLSGAVIFFALLFYLSGFVWIIETEGNTTVTDESILNNCHSLGISEAVRKKSINTAVASEKLLLLDNRLAWCSLNIEGCVLTVNVTQVRENDKSAGPTNLKSTADAIIEKIDVTSGNVLVKPGQTVAKGDILVSGIIESMESTLFVRSSGTVTAKTSRVLSSSRDFSVTQQVKTGEKQSRSVLKFFGIKIPLYLGKIRDETVSEFTEYPLKLFGKALPISICIRKFEFLENREKIYTKEELEELLKRDIEKQIKDLKIESYTVISSEFFSHDNSLTLKTEITATENIVTEEKMLINTVNY